MKSILIIGLGVFGHHLANQFLENEQEVMLIDCDEKKVEDMVTSGASIRIGDCTNPDVLTGIGVRNFDIVFVCIGGNFQNSLEISYLCHELEAKYVVAVATREVQAKFLLRNGANEVVYPEKDIAEKCANRYSMNHVFDYIELAEDYAIYEIPPLKEWVGKSIKESNIAAQYRISILGIKKEGKKTNIMPQADYVIREDEHLLVLTKDETIEMLTEKIKDKKVKKSGRGRR